MRSRTLTDNDSLEALPVDIDGRSVAPEPVEASAAVPTYFEVAAAVRDVLTDVVELRTESPWSVPVAAPTPVPVARSAGTFTRMAMLRPERLARLEMWWHQRTAGAEVVRVARRLWIAAPVAETNGCWRVAGRFDASPTHPALPVELMLWPRFDAFTRMSMEPRGRVHVGRRYYRRGHRALDEFTWLLRRQLV